ncbi:MAG: PilN domain-containing protein [Stellaceae bacterium]
MFHELFAWWIAQLSDCIPERIRRAIAPTQDCLTIMPAEPIGSGIPAIFVSAWSKNRETPLGEFRVKDGDLGSVPNSSRLPVVLRLADSDVLCKTITLPIATERDLAQVLSFEMDRETPFTVDDVLWSYCLIDRNKQRGQITVRLRLISREQLAPLLDALAGASILVTRVEIAGGVDDRLVLPVQTDGFRLKQRGGTQSLRWASVAFCLVLAALVIATPFIRQSRDLATIDREIAASRGAAEQAEHLRQEIDRLEGAGNVVQKERATAGDPLAMLAALTAALPDDTYLTEMQQQQNKVTFGGRSATASRLIGAVARSNELHNPAFVAPVTRTEATHQEVFSITAETGP